MTKEMELREDATAQEDELREWPSAMDERAGRSDVGSVGQTLQSTTAAGQGCRPYGHCVKNAEPRWMALQTGPPKPISPTIAMKEKDKISLRQEVSWGNCLSASQASVASASEDNLGDRGAGTADTAMFAPRSFQNEDTDKFAVLLHGIVSNLQSMTIAVRKMEDWQRRRKGFELRSSDLAGLEPTASRLTNESLVSYQSHAVSLPPRTAGVSTKTNISGKGISNSVSTEGRRGSMTQTPSRRPSLNISAMKLQLRDTWEHAEVGSSEFEVEAVNLTLSVSGGGKAKLRRGRTKRDISQHSTFVVLHPYSLFRLVWNILCLLAIFYDVFVIPLQGFVSVLPEDVETTMRIMDWILASMWTVDVLFSARTGFYVKATLHMEPLDVILHYAKTWMVFDLVLLGYSWYAVITSGIIRFGNVFRARAFWALRWLRLGRIWKMHALWRIIEDQINTNLFHLCFGLVKLTIALVIVVHIVTCIWFYLGESQVNGWTSYYESAMDGPRDFFFWYFASSRWTLAQINGRTDINEKRTIQELYYTCIVAILFAVIFMSIFISSITTTMVELSAAAEAETSTRRILNEYMGYYQVPMVLVGSVKRHLRDMTFQDDERKEQNLLERLPRQLASDLLYEIHAPVLMTAPFFQELDNDCPRVMRHLCFGIISSISVHKWEMIFDFGDVCSRMLVVRKGDLMYSKDQGCQDFWSPDYQNPDAPAPPGEKIHNGSWLCEAALWIEWVNHGRLIAAAQSSLLSLDAKKFAEFLRDYKDAWLLASAYARSFLNAMTRAEEMSDVFVVRLIPSGRNSYESETSLGGTGSQMSKILGSWTAWRPSLNSNRGSSRQGDSETEGTMEGGRSSSRPSHSSSWAPTPSIAEEDRSE